jgi:hypothetical protein
VQIGACFDLDYKLVVDNQIEPLQSQLAVLVEDPDWHFPGDAMRPRAKLPLHSPYIQVLEKPVSECVVNLEERPDY